MQAVLSNHNKSNQSLKGFSFSIQPLSLIVVYFCLEMISSVSLEIGGTFLREKGLLEKNSARSPFLISVAIAAPAPSSVLRGTIHGFNSRYLFLRQKSGQILQISRKVLPENLPLRPGQRIKIFVNTSGKGYRVKTIDE